MFKQERRCKHPKCPFYEREVELRRHDYVRLNAPLDGLKTGFYHLGCWLALKEAHDAK